MTSIISDLGNRLLASVIPSFYITFCGTEQTEKKLIDIFDDAIELDDETLLSNDV